MPFTFLGYALGVTFGQKIRKAKPAPGHSPGIAWLLSAGHSRRRTSGGKAEADIAMTFEATLGAQKETQMKARKVHRVIGVILLLPFFGWAITGLVFFIKPGYAAAYEILTPKTYPLTGALPVNADPTWLEFRYLRTILGDHLLARSKSGWRNFNPTDKQPRPMPGESELTLLVRDAFSSNPARYGNISRVSGDTVWTDTGVEVNIDWNRMSLQQKGKDTDRIDLLYRIHYLQWTGFKSVDKIVGFAGLVLVMALTTLGAWLAFKRN